MNHRGRDLYIIQSYVTGAVKIGRSGDVEARLRQLQTGSPHRLKLLASFEGKGGLEKNIHERVSKHRLHMQGEWFHHECLTDLPDWIYEKLPYDDRWWKVR